VRGVWAYICSRSSLAMVCPHFQTPTGIYGISAAHVCRDCLQFSVGRVLSCRDGRPCACLWLDLPGGVRNREGCQRSAAGPVAARALRRRSDLLGLAVLRHDGQRLLERVRGPADDWRAALRDRWPGALYVGLLTSQPATERRGTSPSPGNHRCRIGSKNIGYLGF